MYYLVQEGYLPNLRECSNRFEICLPAQHHNLFIKITYLATKNQWMMWILPSHGYSQRRQEVDTLDTCFPCDEEKGDVRDDERIPTEVSTENEERRR